VLRRGSDEIGAAMFLSPATVRTHVSHAMGRLGVRDRAQLVVVAHETGLVNPATTEVSGAPESE
jgi:DNA-binding NarL/FixJ family response regulator